LLQEEMVSTAALRWPRPSSVSFEQRAERNNNIAKKL